MPRGFVRRMRRGDARDPLLLQVLPGRGELLERAGFGADPLAEHVQQRLGIGWGATTPDGAVTLEPVFCLGLCACSPAAKISATGFGK